MNAKEKLDQDKRVESAIRSLYTRFPDMTNNHSCRDINTKEIKAIQKKIAARKKVLDNDPETKKLDGELVKKRCEALKKTKEQHERVDVLLRKFQTRGVTDTLLDEVDKMSTEKPVYEDMCGCDDVDED